MSKLTQFHGHVGFISIDCGISANSSYTDKLTNLNYVSDSGFTDAGESKTILPIYQTSDVRQQFLALRSFPRGIRNCYTLKPVQGPGHRYLIRAWFMYGNYDSKGLIPQFDINLGVEKWDKISFSETNSRVSTEIIHVQSSEYIYVCLVNTGHGTPFISALELRYVSNTWYPAEFGSLQLFARVDFGETLLSHRYNDDIYDRIWDPINYLNSSVVNNPETWRESDFNVPYKVMRTAIVPDNSSEPLKISWVPLNASDRFIICLHYGEVQTLQQNETREFNMYLNGNLWTPNDLPITPSYQTPSSVFSTGPELSASRHEIVMQKTKRSTLPPIINALEVYSVRKFQQSQTDDQDASSIMDIKSVYKVQKENWQGDPCAPQARAWNGIGCSYNDSDLPRITSLNLSSSGLHGNIASSIANLRMIRSLDLSNNNLSGEIPDFLSQLTFLRILTDASLGGGDTNRCQSSSCKKSSNKSTIKIAAAVASAVVLILIALIIILLIVRYRKQKELNKDISLETMKRRFTYSEILKITNNSEKIVGRGGFGTVYHGRIALVGYCKEKKHLGIIYEYMANGDLERYLAGRTSYVLSWEQRIWIAIDAAEGFEYLHHGCKRPIIHRDVKSTNILLTENFQGKLSDFGLSRVIPFEAASHITTEVAGTPGYLDPEYYRSNRLTEKSDVYSFGIVLLEIITGRPAVGTDYDREHIVQWVRSRIKEGDAKVIVDSRIRDNVDVNSVWKAVEIALLCVTIASDKRPPMNIVVTQLKECLATDLIWDDARQKELIGVMSLNLESDVLSPQPR
ncbi:hypothetical protein AgCh_006701 [Apium graveolens]